MIEAATRNFNGLRLWRPTSIALSIAAEVAAPLLRPGVAIDLRFAVLQLPTHALGPPEVARSNSDLSEGMEGIGVLARLGASFSLLLGMLEGSQAYPVLRRPPHARLPGVAAAGGLASALLRHRLRQLGKLKYEPAASAPAIELATQILAPRIYGASGGGRFGFTGGDGWCWMHSGVVEKLRQVASVAFLRRNF